jgi:hypothetical protein
MFEDFSFEKEQLTGYFQSALRDIEIAGASDIPEVVFKFSYDAFLKFSIAFCAIKGLRVKSRAGHHIALIEKASSFLEDKEIEVIGNEMRMKRNVDLYSGGTLISEKEAKEYFVWVKELIMKNKKNFI